MTRDDITETYEDLGHQNKRGDTRNVAAGTNGGYILATSVYRGCVAELLPGS